MKRSRRSSPASSSCSLPVLPNSPSAPHPPAAVDATLSTLPNELIRAQLLEKLDAVDLGRLSCCSKEWAQLSGCEALWQALFESRWGAPSALVTRASKLAGGWKKLYASKDQTDKSSAPWTKPCREEVQASVEKLGRRKTPNTPVAVVFLIDGSGSVNAEEFDAMLSFVVDASTQLRGSVDECQVAVVQFSNDVKVESPLGPVDTEALERVKREMVRMNGGTNVAVAVQKAGQLLKRDAPLDAHRQVVLLTDGRVDSYQAHEARQMAEQLADEQRNVSLFAYGVGRGVDRAELLHIIGGPPTCTVTLGSSSLLAAGAGGAAAAAAGAAAGGAAVVAAGGPAVALAAAAAGGAGAGAGGEAAAEKAAEKAAGGSVGLSAWAEDPEDRYLALCVRDEAPW